MRTAPRIPLLLAVLALLLAVGAPPAVAAAIRVQSTTDTIDAGLKDDLLVPMYRKAQPGDTLRYVGVGSGKALDNARAGLADVVITHAPSLEARFVAGGFSHEPFGRALFSSDYVIVGPDDDPARVATVAPHDAVRAFEAIAAAGGSGHAADFISRGDDSGTNVQEQLMWGLTRTVPKAPAFNRGDDTARSEPGSHAATATWYHRTNVGQAANLNQAAACAFTSGRCYTIVDRGTFNRARLAGTIPNLRIVSQHNDPSARGGDNLLLNPFHAYIVDPLAVKAGPPVDIAAATRFVDFLTSPAFQGAVATYPSAADPAFHPDAFPLLTVSTPPPATARRGTAITLGANVANRLPPQDPVAGIHVRLQRSTDDGATWSDVGGPVAADAAGHVVFTTTVGATTRYRIATPRHRDLSPTSRSLGAVTVGRPRAAGLPAGLFPWSAASHLRSSRG